MKVSKSSSGILSSGGAVVASDLTVDGSTVTVDETNNRLGVNTDAPLGTVGIDGDLYFQPDNVGISTSHVYTAGSLDIRATDNIKLGTDGADSVKIGRTNSTAAKVHIRSGGENDVVVSNSMVGIGTDTPTQALELDGNIQLSPTAISTAHLYTEGSLDVRATANIKIGTDGADSVKIGRTNSTAVKCHIRSGADTDLVVSNSMVGIGTDAPDHTLSVAGDIDLTGGLSFDGGTAVTSIDTDLSSVSGAHDTLVTAKAAKAYADSVGGGGTSDLSDVTNTLAVANGGTGATSLTDGGVLLGSGTGSISSTSVLGNGELLIGDASGDPTVATLTGGTGITVTNGAGSISIAADAAQTQITSVGTLTALQVDQINADASTLTITDSTDTGDLCTISVGTHGATTIATVDDDAAAADLTLDVDGDIVLDSAEGKWRLKKDGSTKLKIDHSSGGDITIENGTQDKDLIFAGDDNGSGVTALTLDMSEAGAAAFNSTVTATGFIIGSASISEAELEIIDGATVTTSEFNLLDGDTSVGGSITIADSDGFIVNDGGTMKTIPASDIKTYAGGGGSAADDSNLILHMQVFA